MSDQKSPWRSVVDDLFGSLRDGWQRGARRPDPDAPHYLSAPSLAGTNLMSAFSQSVRSRELRETRESWDSVQRLWQASPLAPGDVSALALEITQDAARSAARVPAVPVLVAVAEALEELLRQESIGDIEPRWDLIESQVETGMAFREMLVRRRRWAGSFAETYAAFLELFSPEKPDGLADRLVIIDPSDIAFPAALNLFDAHLDRVRAYSAADRERVLNGVIELYELFFGAFLGAELTQKQGVVFKYLARLMLAIPEATIHTLMRVMEDGKPYKQYMDHILATCARD